MLQFAVTALLQTLYFFAIYSVIILSVSDAQTYGSPLNTELAARSKAILDDIEDNRTW